VLSMTAGLALAILLCVQCVRTYLVIGKVMVPRVAEHEAERQSGALASSARSAGVTDPKALSPIMERAVEDSSGRVIWMRLLNMENQVVAQVGAPQGEAKVPPKWWESVEKQENRGHLVETPKGSAMVTLVPFRMPRPRPETAQPPAATGQTSGPANNRPAPLVLEVAVGLEAVSGVFKDLRQNLISGMLASVALLVALAVIGLRAPNYLRGKYLENEMQIARHVQSDLLPKPVGVSPHVEFAAAAMAADTVGGDFHDIFETDSGKISLVLGDASGKGVPAALLASVIQGAIRSSSGSQHETSCERINRMLCEKTASERFVTLFWGVFDPLTATMRYVNAGHHAPILLRANPAAGGATERLLEGGPVLGMLPTARYHSGTVQISAGDTLVVYSDGVNEAANPKNEEFGEDRVLKLVSEIAGRPPREICDQVMAQVAGFADQRRGQDDRTLLVVRFLQSRAAMTA
jgi:serine phosphatase RsbU (regulator of sigma subunit)